MELMRFIFSSSRQTFILAVLAGIGSGLCMVGLLALINQALHNIGEVTVLSMGLFTALLAAMVFFRVNSTVLLTKLSQKSIAEMRMRLSKKILAAPLKVTERQGPHKLLATLTDDVAALANGIMRLPFLFINLAVISGCLVYMLWLSWWLFLLALFFIFAGVMVYRLPESRALGLLNEARGFADNLYQGFQAICSGTKELKIHRKRREMFFNGPLQEAAQGYADKTISGTRYYSFAGSFGLLMFFMIIGFLVYLFPSWANLDAATLTGYVMVFLFIQGPMEVVVSAIPELAKTSVGLRKIQKLGLDLNLEEEGKLETPDNVQLIESKQWQTISLDSVIHSYYRELEDTHFQLGPIDMSINRGELIFLIGGNGSGKTTFAKLLLGLYEPESGNIKVDDVIVESNNLESYRQLFSVVFVDFFLFEQLLGFEDTEIDALAESYIEKLQLNHKVKVEDGKLSTVQLSQGQKKRLALLTAYLEDRDFYVFDEWAADQDPLFKRIFYTQILPDLKAKGKTVLVISHDDQYFDIADRYIKMDSGKAELSEHMPEIFMDKETA
ncbi:cyclic peptide export ABC transporter [Sessilibacter corallicola]|uniref:cyclic peptide export ABC transporter n=1 Tax=Sessilibacter corallicola TaxID=2904075 RepID=UPI001E4965D4|nr:cyclic peptide export ABC transporter [Sessilibacter corallicola]MCE2029775.1 cyclic peptide export ABC transporter [Sessilibacter corallicola]